MISLNLHPIHTKKHKPPRHCSLFNLVHSKESRARGDSADEQSLEENNYLLKLQHGQQNLKEVCEVFPMERKMFCPKKIRLQTQKRQISKIYSDNNKIIGVVRVTKALSSKKSPTIRDRPNHILKNYFKHLNLHASNNASFVGASILLHKREGKQQTKRKEMHCSTKSYRNGFPRLHTHASLKQMSSDPAIARQVRYESTQTERGKPMISPWEGAEEHQAVHTPIESFRRKAKKVIE